MMQIGKRTQVELDDRWTEAIEEAGVDAAVPHLYHQHDLATGAEEVLVERTDFFVRLATTRDHRRQGSMLIQRMYSWRGYAWEATGDLPHGPNQITLQACGPEGVFGTLSLRLDSVTGLLADELYRAEVDAHRARGAAVCELTWFAVDRDYGAREVIACLFQLIYMYARHVHGRTALFIEVNPRHVSFYEQRLGFRIAGERKTCLRVGAPAVLMHLDLDQVEARRSAGYDERSVDRRSLYRFFLSRHEEEGLCRRMGLVSATQQASPTRLRASYEPIGELATNPEAARDPRPREKTQDRRL